MRKEKLVDLGSRKVVVKELTVKGLRNFLDNAEKMGDVPLKDILHGENYNKLCQLFLSCTDLKTDELEDLSISEIKALGKAIAEVNGDFFGLLKILGVAASMTDKD